MNDPIGRPYMAGTLVVDPHSRRAGAVEELQRLIQYRRDLLEAREVLALLFPEDTGAVDLDIQQASKAVRDAALELASCRPEVPAEQLAPPEPDVDGFYRAVAGILDQASGSGAARLFRIDREFPGIDRNLRAGAWDIAFAGIQALVADEKISAKELAQIEAAWGEHKLGRPA